MAATLRPLALVTGASRRTGLGAAIALSLARAGWDVATTFWRPYDARMPWGSDPADVAWLSDSLVAEGARTVPIECDLARDDAAAKLFDDVERALGAVTALVLAHAESVDSDIVGTTVESFDRHFAVNVRATWLVVREFGLRFRGAPGRGRIVGITSEHVAGNLPYGASKGAMDRIVLAAAKEFGHDGRGITANVVEPGPTDTGWMTPAQMSAFAARNPQGRVGTPEDCARLVAFLCSPEGGWVNGQLVRSNGGLY